MSRDFIHTNTDQKLSDELVQALASRRAAHEKALALRNSPLLSAETLRKIQDSRLETFHNIARPAGLDLDKALAGMRGATTIKDAAIAAALKAKVDRLKLTSTYHPGLVFPKPEPIDHSFWWAESFATVAPDMSSDFRDDGLHFFGGPKVNTYDGSLDTSFGVVATFILSPDRMPSSTTGRFISSPFVELFGGMTVFAPDWDLIQGDGIAECNLVIRQTLYQFGFGQNGPVPIVVGQGIQSNLWRMYLKNTGYSRTSGLPGRLDMPLVIFNQAQVTPENLIADLEVRFDIHLNCEGALAWCDPEVLIRTFQWSLASAS